MRLAVEQSFFRLDCWKVDAKAEDCTGGETTIGVFKCTETVSSVANTTMDRVFGCDNDGEQRVRIRTQ